LSGRKDSVLRVTHCGQEHHIHLAREQASALSEACALLLLAAQSLPQ